MKFRKAIVLLISMCALCMFGLLLTSEIRKLHNDSVVTEIIIDGRVEHTENFRGFMVVPGGSDEYRIKCIPVAGVYADLIIDFEEDETKAEQNKILKNNARVQIQVDGEVVIDELLATLFESDPYEQVKRTYERKPFYIDVIFYLPENVGNEVKNTTVDFDIVIVVEKQEIMG